MSEPARITLHRRVEWVDTDAAGVYHWNAALRMAEAAEAALHQRLGIRERTFGRTPRVSVSCDFRRELRFYDLVRVDFRVKEVGRTSLRYGFSLERVVEGEGGWGEPPAAAVGGAPAEGGEPSSPDRQSDRGPGSATRGFPGNETADQVAARGELVIVYVTGQPAGRSTPWPDDIREKLTEGGDQGAAGEEVRGGGADRR